MLSIYGLYLGIYRNIHMYRYNLYIDLYIYTHTYRFWNGIYIYHILFSHSSVHGQLDSFHILATVV